MPCCIMDPRRFKTQAVAMPCNFGIRPQPGPPGMTELLWVSPRVEGCLRSGMGWNFGLRWRGTRFCRGGLGSARTTLPTSDHSPPGCQRKPDSCIDQHHSPRAFINNLEIKGSWNPGSSSRRCFCASPRPAAPPQPYQSWFTWWLRTWPGPGLGVLPPPPAPNWLICRCVNKGAAPPPV